MARAINTDFYQAFRFAVSLDDVAGQYLEAQAGFNNVTIPEISTEASEYRDGQTIWTKKYPGPPTVSDSTLQQGVAAIGAGVAKGNPFFNWMMAAIEGRRYRSDITIWHIHLGDGFPPADIVNPASSRAITLYECFPIRVKPDGDLDATSGEVSLREIDVACERIEVSSVEPGSTP